ncbi:MAG: pyruvate kinase, partial [Chloroflexia bacterium]
MRRAKIIATLGPASASEEVIRGLIEAGADAFRLNFSHGRPEEHVERLRQVRRISAEVGRPVAVLQDLAGPKVRTGTLPGGPLTLQEGEEVVLSGRPDALGPGRIPINYPDPETIPPGSRILLDDGRLELQALSAQGGELRCRVIHGGILGEHKGVNFPDLALPLPALTEKDRADLAVGLAAGVDYVAVSFVRRAEDLREARRLIAQQGGGTHFSAPPLIAKIEKPQALEDLPAILEESDGVMVARGDLGVELAPERVPILQKEIIEQANEKGRLVIVATQMLESMMHEPRPTRAEASDVANAVIDGADVLMLSGETAVGSYPLEAVRMMARIIEEAERSGRRGDIGGRWAEGHAAPTYAHAISHAAREIARD